MKLLFEYAKMVNRGPSLHFKDELCIADIWRNDDDFHNIE